MNYVAQFERKERIKKILSVIIYFAIIFALVFVISFFFIQKNVVLGDSMNPLLENGDEVLVDKLAYKIFKPKRGDVIVFKFKYLEDTYYVKRIIGLPGETVQIKGGKIYINDELYDESYGLTDYIEDPGMAMSPITLKDDEYFVLGDNRGVSVDSRNRMVLAVKKSDIVGKVFLRIYPTKNIKIIKR